MTVDKILRFGILTEAQLKNTKLNEHILPNSSKELSVTASHTKYKPSHKCSSKQQLTTIYIPFVLRTAKIAFPA